MGTAFIMAEVHCDILRIVGLIKLLRRLTCGSTSAFAAAFFGFLEPPFEYL